MELAHDMQEIQKATCSRCGTTFVAENATATLCPSCASNQEHHHRAVVVDIDVNCTHFFVLSIIQGAGHLIIW